MSKANFTETMAFHQYNMTKASRKSLKAQLNNEYAHLDGHMQCLANRVVNVKNILLHNRLVDHEQQVAKIFQCTANIKAEYACHNFSADLADAELRDAKVKMGLLGYPSPDQLKPDGPLCCVPMVAARLDQMADDEFNMKLASHTIRIHTEDEDDIIRYFNHHIRHQQHAITVIVSRIGALRNPVVQQENRLSIYKFLAVGPCGVGKTAFAKRMRDILNMAPGDSDECCFVELDFCAITSEVQIPLLTGANDGYKGCDRPALVDHLLLALKHCKAKDAVANPLSPPPIIFLFIDELEKAPPQAIQVLNTFLDTGRMQRSIDTVFQLPPDVHLLIYATSNCGQELLLQPGCRPNDGRIKPTVYAELKARGFTSADERRIGRICAFNPLEEEHVREIITDCLRNTLKAAAPTLQPYSTSSVICPPDVEKALVDNCLSVSGGYDRRHGVAKGCEDICQELVSNLAHQAQDIEKNLKPGVSRPLPDPFTLLYESVHPDQFASHPKLRTGVPGGIHKCDVVRLQQCIDDKRSADLLSLDNPGLLNSITRVLEPTGSNTYNFQLNQYYTYYGNSRLDAEQIHDLITSNSHITALIRRTRATDGCHLSSEDVVAMIERYIERSDRRLHSVGDEKWREPSVNSIEDITQSGCTTSSGLLTEKETPDSPDRTRSHKRKHHDDTKASNKYQRTADAKLSHKERELLDVVPRNTPFKISDLQSKTTMTKKAMEAILGKLTLKELIGVVDSAAIDKHRSRTYVYAIGDQCMAVL